MISESQCKELLGRLQTELDSCENFLAEKARAKSQDFNAAVTMPKDELPLHMSEPGLLKEMVAARIRNEDIDTPSWHVRALYDETFDFEEYKALGENDGELRILEMVFSTFGEKELADRASDAMYTNNF